MEVLITVLIAILAIALIIPFVLFMNHLEKKWKEGRKYYSNGKLLCESVFDKDSWEFAYYLLYPSGKIKNKIKKRQLFVYSEKFELLCQSGVDTSYGKKNKVFILHGPVQGFYTNGHLKFKGKCKNNKFHGDFEFYAENGNLLLSLIFKNGEPLSGVIYGEDGLPRELTMAHIHNIMLDYGFDNMLIDLSWTEHIL